MARIISYEKSLCILLTTLMHLQSVVATDTRAASLDASVIASKYQIMSLAQVCGDYNVNKTAEPMKVNLTSFGQKSAMMLLIADPSRKPSELSADCHISFEAPVRHFLAISYFVVKKGTQPAARTYCPFNLTVRNEVVGESNNLCKPENTSPMLPNLYPRRLTLDIKPLNPEWPHTFQSLIITSVGADSSVCYKDKNKFPCDWERKYNGKWGDLQPKLCISFHLACDDLINCPLSGADEISALCASNRNSHQLGEEYEEKVDISRRIQAVAEQAAADLVLRQHTSSFNVTEATGDNHETPHENTQPEENKSVNVLITTIYCLCGLLISVFILLHFYFRKITFNICMPPAVASQAGESIELGSTTVRSDEPSSVVCTTTSSSAIPVIEESSTTAPPAYATLFPASNKDT